jgi:hypothetical protein
MVSRRRGHGLAELLVTLAFLGTTVAAVAMGFVHGARTAASAGRSQAAVVLAGSILDSLQAVARPADGERVTEGLRASWIVRPRPPLDELEVTVRTAATWRPVLVLRGAHAASPPLLNPR